MKKSPILLFVLALVSCGKDSKNFSANTSCINEIPEGFMVRNDYLLSVDQEEKAKTIGTKLSRMNAEELQVSHFLGRGPLDSYTFRPIIDPYPNAVLVSGQETDRKTEGYPLSSEDGELPSVYETEEGSGVYFMVDFVEIYDPGLGGEDLKLPNGESLLQLSEGEKRRNLGNWYLAGDYLVQGKKEPIDEYLGHMRLCGAKRGDTKVSSGNTVKNQRWVEIATFEFSLSVEPEFNPSETLDLSFPRDVYQVTWSN